jgi:MFS superfamily sulfate permease-like transporter
MRPVSIFKYLQSGVPLVTTLKEYRLAWLSKDSIAGLSACIVSIPSVIAYAELVHLPPIAGLYAALAAAIGYALFSSSRHVIAGPDAAIGLLAGSAILPLSGGDPARIVVLAAVLSILSGVVLLLAARLKLGVIADLLSRPVLIGYLNGASLVLIATQLGKMFGIKTEGEEFFEVVFTVIEKLPQTQVPTFVLGVLLVGLLVGLARWLPSIPGALAVCAVAIVATFALDLGSYGIALVGTGPLGDAVPDDSVVPLGRYRRACAGRRGDRLPGVFGRHSSGADLCRKERLRSAARTVNWSRWARRTYWPGSGRAFRFRPASRGPRSSIRLAARRRSRN